MLSLVKDGEVLDSGRIDVTPPSVFSIDETFDIGVNSGSPVGAFPASYPFVGGTIEGVDIELDG
ncbi:hypothetical protein [Nocardioides sp. B-3]|uniref:hypothetical protein n=1 Tax=Nocardioides sp. B-3 TaxID=2895565 RepID=UPI0021535C5E|nr:hypothetical protein [Nocardioides sp. B-3]UUZ59413.1 hypothetical protein LP418_27050 [Nocardioides sp. B-3]